MREKQVSCGEGGQIKFFGTVSAWLFSKVYNDATHKYFLFSQLRGNILTIGTMSFPGKIE